MLKVKRFVGFVLVLVLVCSLLAGCGNNTSDADGNTLVWLVQGTSKDDTLKVLKMVTEKLEEKTGATVKFKFVETSNYDLVLSSGEKVDLIAAPDYLNYWANCEKAAFAEITDDDLKQFAPYVWENGQDYLAASKYDGVRYGIPGMNKTYTDMCYAARGDLMDKYGIADLNSIENVEKYLDAVAKNEPNMIPFDMTGGQFYWLINLFAHDWGWATPGSMNYASTIYYNINDLEKKPFIATEQPEMKEFTARMKKWKDNGYFSRSVLSNKTAVTESFINGRSALAITSGGTINCNAIYRGVVEKGHEDWDIRFYSATQKMQRQYNSMNTNISISYACKNKELALKVINTVYEDQEIYRLLRYGIEGEHYTVDADGNYEVKLINGVQKYAPLTNGIINDAHEYKTKMLFPGSDELSAKLESTHINDPFINCVVSDPSLREIDVAITEITQTMTQSRCYGFVDDIDKSLADETKALKKAGVEKIMEVWKAKMSKFAEENRGLIEMANEENAAKLQ